MKSPLMEKILEMDFEVLVMEDPLDEFAMSHITEFKEKKF